jgi:hypothetical protein
MGVFCFSGSTQINPSIFPQNINFLRFDGCFLAIVCMIIKLFDFQTGILKEDQVRTCLHTILKGLHACTCTASCFLTLQLLLDLALELEIAPWKMHMMLDLVC